MVTNNLGKKNKTKQIFWKQNKTKKITDNKQPGVVIITVASQQEVPGSISQVGRAFLCGVCMYSPCLCGNMCSRLIIQSVSLIKSTDEDPDLIPEHCTSSAEDGSNFTLHHVYVTIKQYSINTIIHYLF